MTEIIFFGSPKIAADILQAIVKLEEVKVVAVVTKPNFLTRGVSCATDVKKIAQKLNLPVFCPCSKQKLVALSARWSQKIGICVAYGMIIPEGVLNKFKVALNFHASLLPKMRGAAPINHALRNQEPITGISLMKMVKQLDAGPVYIQKPIIITPQETASSLTIKATNVCIQIVNEKLLAVMMGQVTPKPQPLTGVTYAPKITTHDQHVNWQATANQVAAMIRSVTAKPGAFACYQGQHLKILEVQEYQQQKRCCCPPGTICHVTRKGLVIACQQGHLLITRLQKPNQKPTFAGSQKSVFKEQERLT